jgi:hypothetical protein
MKASAPFPILVKPQKYHCQIWAYDPSLSRLYVRIHKGDFKTGQVLYLLFVSTHYFDGPLGWKSADFQLAPFADVVELLDRINPRRVDSPPLMDPTLGFNLYKVTTRVGTVRILAASAHTADLGPDFKMRYPENTPV